MKNQNSSFRVSCRCTIQLRTSFKKRLAQLYLIIPFIFAVAVGTLGAQVSAYADFCSNYADEAVRQHRMNLQGGCGFEGFRWHGWRDGHRIWCTKTSRSQANQEIEERRWRLQKCGAAFAQPDPGPQPLPHPYVGPPQPEGPVIDPPPLPGGPPDTLPEDTPLPDDMPRP